MLRVVLNPDQFDDIFSSKVTKWQMLDYASGNNINLFPFTSLQPNKLAYILGMIIKGENPFNFYDEVFNKPFKDFENMMVELGKNKLSTRHIKKNTEISKSNISTYEYHLKKYTRLNDLLGDKIKNKMTVTSLDFVEYSTLDRAYLLPIMKMTFVQPSALKTIRMEDIEVSSALYINQHENSLIISHIKCDPVEIKTI